MSATLTAEVDVYPSRLDKQSDQLIQRQDPVVYGSADQIKSTNLSPEEIHFFEKNGFLVLKKLFQKSEVTFLSEALENLEKQKNIHKQPEVFYEPDTRRIRSIFRVHELSSSFKQLAHDPRLMNKISALLDSKVYIHQSRVNRQPPFEGTGFYWHSDFETWHQEDGMPHMRCISCMVLLEENYAFNGSLMVMPGSHHQFVPCVGKTPPNHFQKSLVKQNYGVPNHRQLTQLADHYGIEIVTAPAGSVLLFDCNIMHGSASNITPHSRSNVFFVYNSFENQLSDPYCGEKPRPEYIAHRQAKPMLPGREDWML